MDFVTLNNGVKMPKLGYGVYQTPPEETERCVLDAIKIGYRSIDTAQAYGNEADVGAAIKKCGLPREDLFITTKFGLATQAMKKLKFLSQLLCKSCKVTMLIFCLSISPSATIMALIALWKKLTKLEKLEL